LVAHRRVVGRPYRFSLWVSRLYTRSASCDGTPSHATTTTTIHAVGHLWPCRCFTMHRIFSSKLDRRIICKQYHVQGNV